MLALVVNGEPRRSAPGTVADLVREIGLEPTKVAVERNGEIVPKSQHGSTALATGDQLEIVVAVGGG